MQDTMPILQQSNCLNAGLTIAYNINKVDQIFTGDNDNFVQPANTRDKCLTIDELLCTSKAHMTSYWACPSNILHKS